MTVAVSQRSAREYQRSQIETSRPTQLVLMLYDGAIRFLSLAFDEMRSGDIEGRHVHLLKGQRIVAELLSALDLQNGGEVAFNLQRIYTFMLQQLVEANLYDREQPIADVTRLLRDLRESWAELDRNSQNDQDMTHVESSSTVSGSLVGARG